MLIKGSFRNYNDDLITVEIITNNSTSSTKTVGEDGLFFTGEPVEIETDNDDTFNHIIRKSCTINFLTKTYIGTELFADNARSTKVTVTNETMSKILFYGFVDPNTFSQPYTSPLDEFSINCIDTLSTLQYYNYKHTTVNNYDSRKITADNVTFWNIIDTMFSDFQDGSIFYDLSKGVTSSRLNTVFSDLAVSENVFYGEEADDVYTDEEVLTQILQYLNLHIIQEGKDYYIFSWPSIREKKTDWINLTTGNQVTLSPETIKITNEMHSDADTNISIADVYNQIMITCDLQDEDILIESPLDDDSLTSLFSGKQKYMTEYISEGKGKSANSAINNIINGKTDSYDKTSVFDWYMQVMKSNTWKFYYSGNTQLDLAASKTDSNGRYIEQWRYAKLLKDNTCLPCIFSLGSVEKKSDAKDDRPVSSIEMKNYLYISINGNEWDVSDESSVPADSTIQAHAPLIVYEGNNTGGIYSPTDDETTNYLVFSGKLLLQPIVYESSSSGKTTRQNNFKDCQTNGIPRSNAEAIVPDYNGLYNTLANMMPFNTNLVKSDNNGDGRYYVRQFYDFKYPSDENPAGTNTYLGIQPWTKDKSARGYEYKYSVYSVDGNTKHDATDLIRKIDILECELTIGDKRLVEINKDANGNSEFKWVKIGEEPVIVVEGETYPVTTFSLGINPVIGDYIIGDEFDIQNTVSYTMNIDQEGTAIPIKKSDKLSGQLTFKILGPVNQMWNEITRRHPTWFRHTKWYENYHYILTHVENIIIKDFECKICSDAAGNTITEDNDLIYMSAETDKYVNKKDDIEFDIITQLSSAECVEKGISQSYNLNAVIDETTSLPLSSIYNANSKETAKPEEHYVDEYYTEYSTPKILLEIGLHKTSKINWQNLFTSSVLGKSFHVLKETFDVRRNNTTLTLKEL